MEHEGEVPAELASTTPKGRLVILVEDNDDHAELIRRALRRTGCAHELVRLEDGEQALSYLLDDQGDRLKRDEGALVLLDLRLPRVSGLEVLRRLRQSGKTPQSPILVLTTSDADADIAAAYEHGANAYLVKPSDFTSFGALVRDLAQFWLVWNRTAITSRRV